MLGAYLTTARHSAQMLSRMHDQAVEITQKWFLICKKIKRHSTILRNISKQLVWNSSINSTLRDSVIERSPLISR